MTEKTFADILDGKEEDFDEKTFADEISKGLETFGDDSNLFSSGKTLPINQTFKSKEEIRGPLKVVSGWSNDDFIWHVAPASESRHWAHHLNIIMGTAIRDVFNKYLPLDWEMVISPPNPTWSIPDITFKAVKLSDLWSLTEKDLDDMHEDLFQVLSPLITKPRRLN